MLIVTGFHLDESASFVVQTLSENRISRWSNAIIYLYEVAHAAFDALQQASTVFGLFCFCWCACLPKLRKENWRKPFTPLAVYTRTNIIKPVLLDFWKPIYSNVITTWTIKNARYSTMTGILYKYSPLSDLNARLRVLSQYTYSVYSNLEVFFKKAEGIRLRMFFSILLTGIWHAGIWHWDFSRKRMALWHYEWMIIAT